MHLTVTCRSLICCVGGGEKRVVTLAAAYHPVFRVIIYGPWISQASVSQAKLHSPIGSCNFTGPTKLSISSANPSPPLPHVNYLPRSKTLRTGPYKS
jgi:hypothetical protein